MRDDIAKLQAFADNVPEGVLIIDDSENILVFNKEALKLLETSVEEILLQTSIETTLGYELSQAIRDAKVRNKSHIEISKSGRYLHCGINRASGLLDEGKQTIVTIWDVFSLKRLEEVKKEFISAILHKIRSPLATLQTSLSVLHEYQSGTMNDEAREVLEMGRHEIDRLNYLLNSLRDLFIIETGLEQEEIKYEHFTAGSAIEAALKKLLLLHKNMITRVKIDGALSTPVFADFERFCRVLKLIIDNALIFSKDIVSISIFLCDDLCTIKIKDFGIGIAEDTIPLLFTKYFREDNQINRTVQGNGLGLFISRAWMESMSGSISVESVQNQGTTVILTIPSGGISSHE
jgi:two-component system phosphate regulon sensor histidine kinase PhoR